MIQSVHRADADPAKPCQVASPLNREVARPRAGVRQCPVMIELITQVELCHKTQSRCARHCLTRATALSVTVSLRKGK